MSGAQDEPLSARVVVVGGGIAGAWTAHRLAQRGVQTLLVRDDDGIPPLSRIWAPGVIRRPVIDGTVPSGQLFADRSTTQHPRYRDLMARRAVAEFTEYSELVGYYTVDERFFHPVHSQEGIRLTVADRVVRQVLDEFRAGGGTVVEGRVTDLVMDGHTCVGLRYEHDGRAGRISCAEVVLASGGFCGLFSDGVGDNPGYLVGTYARNGGTLANLELFNRFSLGDLDRRRPLYPFDLAGGAMLRRDGEPATELSETMVAHSGDQCDVETFARYWSRHLDIPHTVTLADGTFRLWPVRGFAMGGVAPTHPTVTSPHNVHATGECAYGMSLDSVTGKPFVSFLAAGAELAERLAAGANTPWTPVEIDPAPAAPAPDTALRAEVGQRLSSFQDTRFSVTAATEFLGWCVARRRASTVVEPLDTESIDLLILAEAFTRSLLARRESRGFFVRPDCPEVDHDLDGKVTVAVFDTDLDEVRVDWAPVDAAVVADGDAALEDSLTV